MEGGQFIQVWVPDHQKSKIISPNHHNTISNKWKNIIYYKKRKVQKAKHVISELARCDQFKEETFYKIASLSSSDNIWDYYRILKPYIKHKNIGIKYSNKKPLKNKKSDDKYEYSNYDPETGKFHVSFE